MSYSMQVTKSEFFIEAPNLELARKSLVEAMSDFIWVKKRNALTLEAAVGQLHWALEFDGVDNVAGIEKLQNYECEDKQLFDAIAPYVWPGSFILMSGEDGQIWRWFFDGQHCIEQTPIITWTE